MDHVYFAKEDYVDHGLFANVLAEKKNLNSV